MKNSTRRLCIGGITGALYAALTVILSPISFGAVQCRVSEALCAVAFLVPEAAWGVFLGCAAANLLGGNIFDVIFGSLATLLACLSMARLGRGSHSTSRRLLACLMPVIFNAVTVGAVVTWGYEGLSIFARPGIYALNALWIALGEAAAMYALGLPLMYAAEKLLIKTEAPGSN